MDLHAEMKYGHGQNTNLPIGILNHRIPVLYASLWLNIAPLKKIPAALGPLWLTPEELQGHSPGLCDGDKRLQLGSQHCKNLDM